MKSSTKKSLTKPKSTVIAKKPRAKNPTKKQLLLVKYKSEGMNTYRAAITAGYKHNTAKDANQKILDNSGKSNVKDMFEKSLEKQGLTTQILANTYIEGIFATKEDKMGGRIEDYAVRRLYANDILEIKGVKVKQVDITTDGEKLGSVIMLPE